MPKKKDIWKEIIKILHSTHGEKEIEPWFFGTTLHSLGPRKAVIQTPNRFVAIWLRDHFEKELQDAFYEVCGYRPQISCSSSRLPDSQYQQYQLFYPLNPEYSFESFVLDNSNRFAHAAAVSVANGQRVAVSKPLVIFSPITSGKTHLLHAIGNRIRQNTPSARVGFLNTRELVELMEQVDPSEPVGDVENYIFDLDILLMDDIHLLARNAKAQEIILSICEGFTTKDKPMVFATCKSPGCMKEVDPHLISRLQSGILAEIPRIEEQTRINIVRHKLARQSLELTDDIIFYLSNMTSDLRELLSYSEKIAGEISNGNGRSVELSHIKRLLGSEKFNSINIRYIQESVAHYYGLHPSELRSHSRERRICQCKHIAMYLCKEILGARLMEIAEAFGKMNHTSVLYALKKIENAIEKDKTLIEELNELKRIITYC